MGEKICAVVVTYNRLNLLKECIEALRNQTRKLDEIIVVNNDSKDGTKEWLNEQKDLTKIHQENLGGAGGFHNGMKAAYEKGYDWIWLMDDDGLPMKDALAKLLKYNDGNVGVLNSVVVSNSNQNELAFGLEDSITNKYFSLLSEINNMLFINGANLFNGTMISKKTIAKTGLPNAKFFIYGDELDYYYRIKENDIRMLSIPDSILNHPNQDHRYIGTGKLFYRLITFNSLGVKYFPRNLMAIWYFYKEYTFRRLFKTYLYDIFGILFIQKNITYTIKYIVSIFSGISFIQELKKMRNNNFEHN